MSGRYNDGIAIAPTGLSESKWPDAVKRARAELAKVKQLAEASDIEEDFYGDED